nr:hypothetical protein [Phycisphaerales bacterium]
ANHASIGHITPAALPASLAEVVALIEQRMNAPEQATKPHLLVIAGLERLPAFQHKEDAFDFSSDAPSTPMPDALLERIMRDGPALGVHTIITADTGATVTRSLRRKALAACDIRVCTQMSVNDSSAIVDSAAASRLGPNRILLVTLSTQQAEKLRTFSLPTDAFIASLPPYDPS